MPETMSYVGKKPCGCVVAAVVDDPNHKRDVARTIAEWVKGGLTVERVTHDYVRQNFTLDCQHRTDGQMSMFDEVQR